MSKAQRLMSKRINRREGDYRWQRRLIAGHHYRWMLAARGRSGYGTWDRTRTDHVYGPGKRLPKGIRRDWERSRLRALWGCRYGGGR